MDVQIGLVDEDILILEEVLMVVIVDCYEKFDIWGYFQY